MANNQDDIASQLVALYHEVLTTVLDTPEAFLQKLSAMLKQIIPCDGLLTIFAPDRADNPDMTVAHVHFPLEPEPGKAPKVEMESLPAQEGRDLLEELIARGEDELRQMAAARHSSGVILHTYWFRTERQPRNAGCVFRMQTPDQPDGQFTGHEQQILQRCETHLGLCLRLHSQLSRSYRDSFEFFATICHQIANTHGLTNSESRVLQKMVEGSSNNDICRDLLISLATVKTHISHILQKTGCRNRADLIGKYFSSKQVIAR